MPLKEDHMTLKPHFILTKTITSHQICCNKPCHIAGNQQQNLPVHCTTYRCIAPPKPPTPTLIPYGRGLTFSHYLENPHGISHPGVSWHCVPQ